MNKDELISVQQFEMVYATALSLIRASNQLFDITESMEPVHEEVYIEVIRLHNAACDFIKAYQNYQK